MYGFGLNQPKGVETPRTTALINKVFDHLDKVDVDKLSTAELKDFLEVVQKGQFLESYGQMPALGFNSCVVQNPAFTSDKTEAPTESEAAETVEK